MPKPWEKYQSSSSSDGPWTKYQSSAPSDNRVKNTEVESAVKGGINAITGGFARNIQGIAKTVGEAQFKPMGLSDLITSYRKNRDEADVGYQKAEEDNPKSYLGGEIFGSAAMSVVPGFGWMNAAKGASIASKIGAAAKTGAFIGAGTSNADLTKGEIEQFGKDVVQGGLTGSVVQGALSGARTVFKGVLDRFKNVPETRAVKAVTGQNISALRQISNSTLKSAGDIDSTNARIVKVGRDILDEPGVLTPLSKVEDIGPRLGEARQKYGELIGKVGSEIDKSVPKAVDAKNIANKIVSYAESVPETMHGQKLRDKLLEEAANFEKISALSFEDAQKFKNQFKYKAVDADALISNQDATNKVRGIIAGEMDQTASNLAEKGPQEIKDLLNNYALYKSKYGSFKAASDAATDRIQKNMTNRFVSPSDYGIGSAVGVAQALTQGGPSLSTLAAGAAAAGVNKFARERGSALAAKTADGILKAYKSGGVQALLESARPVIDAARKGNPSAVLTFQIMSESNPEAVKYLQRQEAMQRRRGAE